MSQRYLFDVFGRIMLIERSEDGWAAFYVDQTRIARGGFDEANA